MSTCQSLAPGLRVRLAKGRTTAAAEGAARFYNNDRVSLPALGDSLLVRARQAVKQQCRE